MLDSNSKGFCTFRGEGRSFPKKQDKKGKEHMATKPMRRINIIGHQNPDTDSICSALAYAWLKNRGSLEGLYEARRAGHINRETRFVLQHFGIKAPRLCTDVSPQIKDIDIRKQAGIDGEMSVRAAWNLMRDVEIDTLCIVDDGDRKSVV